MDATQVAAIMHRRGRGMHKEWAPGAALCICRVWRDSKDSGSLGLHCTTTGMRTCLQLHCPLCALAAAAAAAHGAAWPLEGATESPGETPIFIPELIPPLLPRSCRLSCHLSAERGRVLCIFPAVGGLLLRHSTSARIPRHQPSASALIAASDFAGSRP